jgi:uncharacterized membrane protein YvlD (DUF360 family)
MVLRIVATWLVETLGLLLFAWILPGVEVQDFEAALVASALIGVLNAVLYPAAITVFASIAAATFGLLSLALNAAVVMLADAISPGFNVTSFGEALLLVLGLALVNALLTGILSIDDEGSYYRGVILRQARRSRKRAGEAERESTPGILFLEIDGLSEKVFHEALDAGRMPNLAAWIATGTHTIVGWECDLSSQTSASQAGLLQGSNVGIPAFRWYDRELGRPLVSAKPADAAIIQERTSSGDGLLVDGGASRGNLVTGDAPYVTLTISTLTGSMADRPGRKEAWRAYLSNPYAVPRTLLMFVGDVLTELREARRQRRAGDGPRVDRKGKYPIIRAATTSFIPEATVSMLVGDVFRGVPSAYATFVSYDEIAHHSGVRARDALAILERLDRTFERIRQATELAPRPYEIVVLSDHGQSAGATFLQRYGESFEDVVRRLSDAAVHAYGGTDDEAGHQLGVALGEVGESGAGPTRWLAQRAHRSTAVPAEEVAHDAGDTLVYGSGNLGLVYFSGLPERQTLEQIRARHPELVAGLAAHEGVAFVAGVSSERGPLAIGPTGEHELRSGRVIGEDPLVPFGPRTAEHLRRELAFDNAPDLLAISRYDPETEEVAAFEELIGSHGGLGGPQAHPFLMHPSRLEVGDGELVGAAAVHALMKSWLREAAEQAPERPAAPTSA